MDFRSTKLVVDTMNEYGVEEALCVREKGSEIEVSCRRRMRADFRFEPFACCSRLPWPCGRARALVIPGALEAVRNAISNGVRDVNLLRTMLLEMLSDSDR